MSLLFPLLSAHAIFVGLPDQPRPNQPRAGALNEPAFVEFVADPNATSGCFALNGAPALAKRTEALSLNGTRYLFLATVLKAEKTHLLKMVICRNAYRGFDFLHPCLSSPNDVDPSSDPRNEPRNNAIGVGRVGVEREREGERGDLHERPSTRRVGQEQATLCCC
ncbi:hypothetical protein C8F04DRAFT_1082297 [Mycena alexandri]|uniref:Uncharacterized protein n=1 Tax=Mycena alexandri TaxID=1745969 RepID=A0AAD6T7F5_9AGAR|nr:hypothetical protein C8F04DRAFT_1082297 [Mycena alexandri]